MRRGVRPSGSLSRDRIAKGETESEKQLAHLNAYLSVSSMLAQYLGLEESLEIALYCCMEVVSAEAASVLLLDDEKANFRFYQIEGPAKPVLAGATFPADKKGDKLRLLLGALLTAVGHPAPTRGEPTDDLMLKKLF